MLTSVEGVYLDGVIKLAEQPGQIPQGSPAIVTFLTGNVVDLRAHGISESEAADLRARLAPFAEDWNSPEMSAYDNYSAHKRS